MLKLRQVLFEVALGMVLATVIVDVAAPGVIVWFNVPSTADAMCLCGVQAHDTARHMVQAHLAGMAVGGLIALAFGLVLRRAGGGKARPAPEPPNRPPV